MGRSFLSASSSFSKFLKPSTEIGMLLFIASSVLLNTGNVQGQNVNHPYENIRRTQKAHASTICNEKRGKPDRAFFKKRDISGRAGTRNPKEPAVKNPHTLPRKNTGLPAHAGCGVLAKRPKPRLGRNKTPPDRRLNISKKETLSFPERSGIRYPPVMDGDAPRTVRAWPKKRSACLIFRKRYAPSTAQSRELKNKQLAGAEKRFLFKQNRRVKPMQISPEPVTARGESFCFPHGRNVCPINRGLSIAHFTTRVSPFRAVCR